MSGTIPTMERIYTTPLLDKLGVRPGMRVAIVGRLEDDDEEPSDEGPFAARLADRTTDVTIGKPKPDTDIVFLAADTTDELTALARLRPSIRPAGAIWVAARDGQGPTPPDVAGMAAAPEPPVTGNKAPPVPARPASLPL